jgi:aminomethyltransferase
VLDKDFVGAERLRAQVEQGTAEKLVPFVFTGPGIPRQGNDVLKDGERIGSVTSGTLSPCLEAGIGMAYVSAALTEPGTDLIVDVRGKERPARVSTKPLYRKED